jgi:hypothetical protein
VRKVLQRRLPCWNGFDQSMGPHCPHSLSTVQAKGCVTSMRQGEKRWEYWGGGSGLSP